MNDEAVTAAARVIHSLTCGECDYHPDDLTMVTKRDLEDAAKVLGAAYPAMAADAVKEVQRWMTLNLWMALGGPSQHFDETFDDARFDQTWSECLAAVRDACTTAGELEGPL